MILQKSPLYCLQCSLNLLVNGSTGISAGYATEIPPHQLGEVIDAAIMRIDKPEATVADLMTVIKGPDFPTGGIIQGIEGIRKAYETGKGKNNHSRVGGSGNDSGRQTANRHH
ncbi:DNA gyrase subunit A [Peribacillus frigoritolerans]|nr:DNA gyrase subunit A [Peribacillus frigoritolerans]